MYRKNEAAMFLFLLFFVVHQFSEALQICECIFFLFSSQRIYFQLTVGSYYLERVLLLLHLCLLFQHFLFFNFLNFILCYYYIYLYFRFTFCYTLKYFPLFSIFFRNFLHLRIFCFILFYYSSVIRHSLYRIFAFAIK